MIILVVGLPGSGKSYLIKNNFCYFDVIVDDPKDISEVINKNFNSMVIADPNFCNEKILNIAMQILKTEYPMHEIIIQYFENNPEQCKINAKKRINKNVNDFIDLLSMKYNPPCVTYKVYNENEGI